MINRIFVTVVAGLLIQSGAALADTRAQDAFFNKLKTLCGKAFAGTIVVDTAPSTAFSNKALVMHVRHCEANKILIPFHVGDDASRTWVITRTETGLLLKHDHRHKDGSEDVLSQYGGHSLDAGWPEVQSFPADDFTKALFVKQAIPQSIGNTWQLYHYPNTFTYRLVREAREFRVDFDLNQPVAAPPTPWGWQ